MSTTESSAFVEDNENGPASISAPPHAINNNDSHNIDAPLGIVAFFFSLMCDFWTVPMNDHRCSALIARGCSFSLF